METTDIREEAKRLVENLPSNSDVGGFPFMR